ncbi:hypothetical protein P4O66_000319 [Electrophorus voltai]|uniref:Protocadherin gamma-C3 n=1 Tax=Electrophorus voltai TaxID=2609070 RepID=A0AAD9E0Z2_9TELE|nr:hypothetical protein P4O66_000319 [Electrophorus voltai]
MEKGSESLNNGKGSWEGTETDRMQVTVTLVLSLLDSVLPQLRYTVHEELEHGAFVGNIAEDLGLDANKLSTLEVEILDVNDNSPSFPWGEFNLNISESAIPGDGSKFAELILESPLDREQQKTHQMVLTAVDGGLPERSSTTQINIVVLDANDNAPVFDQNFYKVKGLVDYEKARMHEIYVQAKDKGPSAVAVHCRVLVSVVDVNDNLPEVILTSVSTPVREDAPPGTVIAVISVMDPDSGENGNVHCEIPHHVPFQLYSPFKNHYTLVTSDFLDRETVSEYNVTITARDMGSPPLFTKKSLLVQVYDINDNVPWFKQPSYTVYLTENNAPGASVFTVTAQDADVDQNSYLSYSILESVIQAMPVSTYMSINSDNGNIYALRSFDHEELRSFNMVIQAEDAGFPSLCANVTVNVFILDQNDNAPVIISPLSENGTVATEAVPRSADVGYLVVQITATDADEGQNSRLFYQVMQATDPSLFSVGLYTGEIRTIRRMVEKDPTRHRLVIMLKDNGQPPLSATTSIILSVVDSVPKPASTGETLKVLCRETVDNVDTSIYEAVPEYWTWRSNAVTRYSIPEEIPEGSVVTNLAADLGLDARSLPERKTSSSCFLKMDVIIEYPIRIFNIELEIMDINDNSPQFRRERITLDISESATPGERFSLTNAVDADVGENSIKKYYLSDSDEFTIDIQSGSDGTKYVDLVLKDTLDREKQAVHNLILTAVDGGTPARSGTASVVVQVLDTNDNSPQFDRQVYSVDLIENASIGTLVMQLNATDLDEGTNAALTYSYTLYTSEKTQEKFSLNPNTGEIRVKDVIDFEEIKSFDMYVEAKDNAANPLSGQ